MAKPMRPAHGCPACGTMTTGALCDYCRKMSDKRREQNKIVALVLHELSEILRKEAVNGTRYSGYYPGEGQPDVGETINEARHRLRKESQRTPS